jgi:branched-chain amino acid transport system ATP-binding protein
VLAALRAEGQAILLIDKNLGAIMRLADRHVVIEKGQVVWTGTSADLAAAPEVRDTWLHV